MANNLILAISFGFKLNSNLNCSTFPIYLFTYFASSFQFIHLLPFCPINFFVLRIQSTFVCSILGTHMDIFLCHNPESPSPLLHSSFSRGRLQGCYISENVLVSLPHTTWYTCSMRRKHPVYHRL